jgi:small nuclear ribonucleoprotein (snRNP)-like protein
MPSPVLVSIDLFLNAHLETVVVYEVLDIPWLTRAVQKSHEAITETNLRKNHPGSSHKRRENDGMGIGGASDVYPPHGPHVVWT